MVWVRIDDQFAEDPKVVEVGPLGMALQVAALCYANRKLTNGEIPRPVARTLLDFEVETDDGRRHTLARTCGMAGEDIDAQWIIDLLVDAGLWHEPGHDCPDCPPVDRGYYIHDYLEYQPSRDDVENKREKTAERVRKHRKKKKEKRNADGNGGRNGVTNGDGNEGETQHPEPVPEPKEEERPDPAGPDEFPDEVVELTRHLARRVQANGFPVPSKGTKRLADWLTEMDRLVRLGPPGGNEPQDPDEIAAVIDWSTTDDFWRPHVQSASKFREKFPQLRLQMRSNGSKKQGAPQEVVL